MVDALTAQEPGFISLVGVVELVWALTGCYGLKRDQIAQALDLMLRSPQLHVDQAEQVMRALHLYRSGRADFADCLIERMAAAAGCTRTMTFDRAAAKAAGMALLA